MAGAASRVVAPNPRSARVAASDPRPARAAASTLGAPLSLAAPATGPYAGARVACVTKHEKARWIAPPFAEVLGARVFEVREVDTDRFGTFSGEVPRVLSPVDAARAKIAAGRDVTDAPVSIATEGSFSAGFGLGIEHHEVLLLVDHARGLELTEQQVTRHARTPGRAVRDAEDACLLATQMGFPAQGVMVRTPTEVFTDLDSIETVRSLTGSLLQREPVYLELDYRAHRCPDRAEVIGELAARMARRLATACPACDAPGFGRVDVVRGAPCAQCGLATRGIVADVLGCAGCEERRPVARPMLPVDPRWCDHCNP